LAALPNPVVWFEIAVADLTRAKAFYESTLQVTITLMDMGPKQMGWFPAEVGGAGAAGSLVQADDFQPSHDGTLVYLHVDAIDSTLEAINQHGGKTLMEPMRIGDHGSIAYFQDSEGNRIGLHQSPSQGP